jgi:hypothetical protein
MPRKRYGRAHQRTRAAALRAWSPGEVCPRCGHPVDPGLDELHLDHDEDGGYLGLSHGSPCRTCGRRCNLQHGGLKSAQLAGKQPSERRCVICGTPYKASRGSDGAAQRTCGNKDCVQHLKALRRARKEDPAPPDVTGRTW